MDKQLKIQEFGLKIKLLLIFPFSLLCNKTVSTEDKSFSLMFVKVQRGSEGKKKTQNQQKTQAIFGSALQNRNRILNDKYNHAGSPTQGAVSQQLREFFSC